MKCNNITLLNSTLYRIYLILRRGEFKSKIFNQAIELKGDVQFEVHNIEDNCNIDINSLFKDLFKYCEDLNVYLHGSWSDNSRTPFSDIDDFIVLKNSCFTDKRNLRRITSILNKIDMKFCRIDPLQHHGHWIVCENELLDYDNSFIPFFILNDSKRVIGSNKINGWLNENKTNVGLKHNLINTCKSIRFLSDRMLNGKINAYELKCLVGSFALIPAFIYQLQGVSYNKQKAIKESKKIFTQEAYSCIEWATECRSNWGIIVHNNKFKFFSYMTYCVSNPHLWRRISSRFSPGVSEIQFRQLSNNSLNVKVVNLFLKESLNCIDVR